VIIADNGSTDGTVRLVGDARYSFDVILSKGTGTVTDAILRGIREASSDKIIVLDADLSHPPEVVHRLVTALDEHDMVVGSRYIKGGSSKDTCWNRFLSGGLNLLSFPLVPRVKDRASGFFGIRKSLVDIPIRNTIKPMLEYLVRANPVSVCEVPYTFQPRKVGEAKLGKPILKTLLDLGFLYLQKYNRFLKYCVVGGIGTLIVLGVTYLCTEVAGLWYMLSLVIAALVAAVWNFTGHRFVTYAKERAHLEPNYEWDAWYRGNPLQKFWKRKIGDTTKEFLGSPDSLLDVGCGSSPVINLFHCTRVGLDVSQKKLDFISKYSSATFLQSDFNGSGMPTFTEGFEAIICNNNLEHLGNPERVVEDISKRLLEGGKVVITVPSMGRGLTRLVEWLYERVMPGGYAAEHCFKFTTRSLDELCGKYGLKLVSRKSVFTDMVCLYVK